MGRPQDASDKENVTTYKKFNAVDRGCGFKVEEHNKDNGGKPLRCWTCGGEHHSSDRPSHQGGISAQEAQKIGDVFYETSSRKDRKDRSTP